MMNLLMMLSGLMAWVLGRRNPSPPPDDGCGSRAAQEIRLETERLEEIRLLEAAAVKFMKVASPGDVECFADGDRVRRKGWRFRAGEGWGEGTVQSCPRPNQPKVMVRWDEFGEEFDGNCNDNLHRDFVLPESLIHVN